MNEICQQKDLVRSKMFWLMWALTAVAVGGQIYWTAASPWFAAGLLLAWAAFCGINAQRCGRTHCYLTAPILFVGAVAMLLLHFEVIRFPGYWVNALVFGGIAIGCLTEMAFGKYTRKA